jgi:Transposase DDE domain
MKAKYRIRNWSQYNKSLIQRGSLTVWLSEDAVKKWLALRGNGKKGRPELYSDDAILTALMIRFVFHLPLRALQGFLTSLIMLLSAGLPVPSYTQICRRAKTLGQELKKLSRRNITDIVIDSTGLKVYGEGEWKVRQHGFSKRRTWKKVHLAVCPDSHEILLEVLTDNKVADCTVYPKFLEALPKSVKRTFGDGAYDTEGCYGANLKHGSTSIIPPDRNAVFRKEASPAMEARNNNLLEIMGLGGDDRARKLWKKLYSIKMIFLLEGISWRLKFTAGEAGRVEKHGRCSRS